MDSFCEGPDRRLNPNLSIQTFFNSIQLIIDNFAGRGGKVAMAINNFEENVYNFQASPAAFSVLLQRPSLTGSERFKLNELEDKPEQEEGFIVFI